MYRKGNVPSDPAQMPQFLNQELSNIERAQNESTPFMTLDPIYAEPAKYWDGMIVFADGTTWDPGSGGGVYLRRAGVWRFLG